MSLLKRSSKVKLDQGGGDQSWRIRIRAPRKNKPPNSSDSEESVIVRPVETRGRRQRFPSFSSPQVGLELPANEKCEMSMPKPKLPEGPNEMSRILIKNNTQDFEFSGKGDLGIVFPERLTRPEAVTALKPQVGNVPVKVEIVQTYYKDSFDVKFNKCFYKYDFVKQWVHVLGDDNPDPCVLDFGLGPGINPPVPFNKFEHLNPGEIPDQEREHESFIKPLPGTKHHRGVYARTIGVTRKEFLKGASLKSIGFEWNRRFQEKKAKGSSGEKVSCKHSWKE